MKPLKAKTLKEMALTELRAKLKESQENHFKLRLRKENRQLDDVVSVRVARKDIARLKTIIHQKEAKDKK